MMLQPLLEDRGSTRLRRRKRTRKVHAHRRNVANFAQSRVKKLTRQFGEDGVDARTGIKASHLAHWAK